MKEITPIFMIIVLLIVIFYDILAYVMSGNDATISNICLETAEKYKYFTILVTLAVGILLGHLFVPQHVSSK